MTTDIAERIRAATGATDVSVTTGANGILYAQLRCPMLGERALMARLTAAGIEPRKLLSGSQGFYSFYVHDTRPPQPTFAGDAHDGICNRCGKPIPFGHEQAWNPATGEHYHAYCAPVKQPGDGIPPSEPNDVGTDPAPAVTADAVYQEAADYSRAAAYAEQAVYDDMARQVYAWADAEDRAEAAQPEPRCAYCDEVLMELPTAGDDGKFYCSPLCEVEAERDAAVIGMDRARLMIENEIEERENRDTYQFGTRDEGVITGLKMAHSYLSSPFDDEMAAMAADPDIQQAMRSDDPASAVTALYDIGATREHVTDAEWNSLSTMEQRDAYRTLEKLFDEAQRVVRAVPECPSHGYCVPHAVAWVEQAKAAMEAGIEQNAIRQAAQALLDCFTFDDADRRIELRGLGNTVCVADYPGGDNRIAGYPLHEAAYVLREAVKGEQR